MERVAIVAVLVAVFTFGLYRCESGKKVEVQAKADQYELQAQGAEQTVERVREFHTHTREVREEVRELNEEARADEAPSAERISTGDDQLLQRDPSLRPYGPGGGDAGGGDDPVLGLPPRSEPDAD